MSLKSKAIKGAIWSSAESWGTQAVQFITFFLLARLLTPEYFGLVSISNIFIHFIQALISSGFSQAIIQRKDLEPEHTYTAFWCNLAIGFLLMIISILMASPISTFFGQPETKPIICWLSLTVLINSINGVQTALLTRKYNFKALAKRRLIGVSTGGVAGIFGALFGLGVWSLVIQAILTSLVSSVILWNSSEWRPQPKVSLSHLKDIFSFGINIVGIGLLSFLSVRADDFLIGYYLGPTALGYYTVAYKLLVSIVQVSGEIVKKVSIPVFSELQTEKNELKQFYYKASEGLCIMSTPCFFWMCFLAPEIILTLFGDQWEASIPVMRFLGISGLARIPSYLTGSVLICIGQPFSNLVLSTFETFVRVVTFYFVAPKGIEAISLCVAIFSFVSLGVRIQVLRKVIGLQLPNYINSFSVPWIASSGSVFVVFILKRNIEGILSVDSYASLSLYLLVGFLTYCIFVHKLYPTLYSRVKMILQK